jgi:hypothetical protein
MRTSVGNQVCLRQTVGWSCDAMGSVHCRKKYTTMASDADAAAKLSQRPNSPD